MNATTVDDVYTAAKDVAGETPAFEQIYQVIALARQVALENFYLHLAAVVGARDDDERDAARDHLIQATQAVATASDAYQRFIASESEFTRSACQSVAGTLEAARQAAKASGGHMEAVADRLDQFADYAPKSALLGRALQMVAKADAAAGSLEAAASKQVDGFVRGLKGFASRVVHFARQVANLPDKIASTAKEQATAKADAFVAALRGASQRANKVKEVARQQAWDVLDKAADASERFGHRVDQAVDVVSVHGAAVFGVVKDLAGSVISVVSHRYSEHLAVAQANRARGSAQALRQRMEGYLAPPAADSPLSAFVIRGFADGALLEDRASGDAIRFVDNEALAAIEQQTPGLEGLGGSLRRFAAFELRLKEVLSRLNEDDPDARTLHERLKHADFASTTRHEHEQLAGEAVLRARA